MKQTNIFVFFVLSLFFGGYNIGLAQEKEKISYWPRGITYEIFVQSFADSNGDGIGDINGMTSKLDYLKDLGVEGIWLMPINPSPSYHKYDVADYYDIHPDYGTLNDFKRFIQEAHQRGIRVIMDLVINHSSDTNRWFQEALKNKENKYWDYYVWTHKDDPVTKVSGRIISDDSHNRNRWNKIEGSDYLYYSYFGAYMPDLNFDNPLLRAEIFNIGKFWLQDVGVDGFRLDAARHIFPTGREKENHAWWEYFMKEMKNVKPDVFLVGEVWTETKIAGPYLKGLSALFNFDLAKRIVEAVNQEKGNQIVSFHKEIQDYYKSINPEYIDATFLTNHDQNRILSSVNADMNKAKMAASLLLTLPGSPYLYYGEEIGMLGEKPDKNIREPFLWDTKREDSLRASWISPTLSNDSSVMPLSMQLTDDGSIYNHYRKLIHLRRNSAALSFGDISSVDLGHQAICSFLRSEANESVLVIHNLSGINVKVKLPDNLGDFDSVLYSNKEVPARANEWIIPGYSTVIIK